MRIFEVWYINADYGEPEHFIAICETPEKAIELAQEYYEEDARGEIEDWRIEELGLKEYCFALDWLN